MSCFIYLFVCFSLSVLQVNRIKIPKQIDELVEMESESANPAAKFIFRVKTELHGVRPFVLHSAPVHIQYSTAAMESCEKCTIKRE